MVRVSLLMVLIFIASRVFAFEILRVKTFNDRDGLTQNTVRCMVQDDQGFMWMGTINGLNRFDGRTFKTVQPRYGFSMTHRDNRISNIYADNNGYLWVHTYSNMMLCYNPRLEEFIDYAPENKTKIFSGIKVASNGDVWLWGDQGACRIRLAPEKSSNIFDVKTISKQKVTFVFDDFSEKVWLAIDKELYMISEDGVTLISKGTRYLNAHRQGHELFFIAADRIDPYDIQTQTFLPGVSMPKEYPGSYNNSSLLNDGFVLVATTRIIWAFDTKTRRFSIANKYFGGKNLSNASFFSDNIGNLWLYNGSGVLWRHFKDNTFRPLRLISPEILSIIGSERYQVYHDSRGIIWISTFGNGLFAIDENGEQLFHCTAVDELPTDYLLSVTEDASGEIWVGTELSGVSKISLTDYPLTVFYPNPVGDNDRDNAVRMILVDENAHHWLGTRDGYLHVCDSLLKPIFKHQLKGGIPYAITEDDQGLKWVGTKGGGVLVFDTEGRKLLNTYLLEDQENQSSSSNNVYTLVNDSQGRMWIATFGGGLHLVHKQVGNGVEIQQISMKNDAHNMMRGMIQDREGLIWVGTNDGLVVFNPDSIVRDTENYLTLKPHLNDWQAPNSNEVRVVFEDSRGDIWVGITGGGLNRLVKNKSLSDSQFVHYGVENGLVNEMIQSIQEDDDGHIWVSTENGISKFNLKQERFENFSFSSNRHADIFNELASWKTKDGQLMFGSYNGVYILDPKEIKNDTYAPQVVFTGLRINGIVANSGDEDSPLDQSISYLKEINLKHNQNSISLEYSMFNYHNSEYNQFVCFLEGYDKNWSPISRNNISTYRNLPPGTYRFRVKGSNSFGIWSENETIIKILISPPWWKTVWAMGAYLTLSAIIIFFALRLILKIHRLNTALEVEKQLTEHKLRFYTNISHEFRTPLTIIHGTIENLSFIKGLPYTISKQIKTLSKSSTRLLRLIDQLLEFRRLQNDKMELTLEETEACGFFLDIWETIREMAEKKRIEYLFKSNEKQRVMLLDRGKMDKIAYNLLSNAIKNTPMDGKIVMKLNFSDADDKFILRVSDSGPGISNEQRDMLFVRFQQINYDADGTGVGLHLTSELAKVHKGSIVYSESEWGGACFSLEVPLSDDNYDPSDRIVRSPVSPKNVFPIESGQSMAEEAELLESLMDQPSNDYKVMIVEDEDDVRSFIEDELKRYFSVVSVCNGVEALEKVNEEQPDIVVCDVMMPEMNGLEFTKRMRKNFESSHIPIILLTAYSAEEQRLKGIQSGADSYITKPFSTQYLLTRIVKLIEQREKLKQKFSTEPGLVRSSIGFTNRDQLFLDQLHDIIEKNMDNSAFKLETFAQSLEMSRTTFFRKVKGLTGYPPNNYVRIIRMKRAAELLTVTDLNVSEISYKVGINDPFYFSKCFKVQFGKSPTQYRDGA